MCPIVTQIVQNSLPRVGRRGGTWLALALLCLLLGARPASGAFTQQWTQYQRYASHTGTLLNSLDPLYALPGATAPAALAGGSDLQWVVDTRGAGPYGGVHASVSAVANAGAALLGVDLAPAGTTLTLSADPSGRIAVGDLLTVDAFPANRAWAAATVYTLGQRVRPNTANGYYYTCTGAGTSGATEPSAATIPWPQVNGATIIDGTVTWSCHAGEEALGAVTAVAGAVITFTNPTTITHVAGSKVYYTPVVVLQQALPAIGINPNQLPLTAASIARIHVGDILFLMGDPASAGPPATPAATPEYLGPVLSIDRTLNIATITYPYVNSHLVTDQVLVSPYRQDTITSGDLLNYSDQSCLVNVSRTLTVNTTTTNWLESSPWYDTAVRPFAAMSNLAFFTQITPTFTDNSGNPLPTMFRTDGTTGNQEIHVGFRGDVPNPTDGMTDSPIYIYAYLKDTGELGIRRRVFADATELKAPAPQILSVLPMSTTWQPASVYEVGQQVLPTTPTGWYYRCSGAGTSNATEPTWPKTPGATLIDGTITWTAYPVTTTWQATAAYILGQDALPTTPNGLYYQCTIAGTSGATQPTWPTSAGATCTDGTATWTAIASASGVQLALALTCSADGTAASATLYYRLPTNGQYPTDYSGFTALGSYTLPSGLTDTPAADVTDTTLPSLVSPYLQGDNFTNFPATTTWLANAPYNLGDTVQPPATNGYYYKCTAAGTSGATVPTWPTTAGATCTDNTVTWTAYLTAPQFSFNATQLILYGGTNPITGGPLDMYAKNCDVNYPEQFNVGDLIDISDPSNPAIHDSARITGIAGDTISFTTNLPGVMSVFPAWQANTAYTIGVAVQPTPTNGCYYTCTGAGASGATPPAWTTSGTISDGTVIWAANLIPAGTLGNSYPLGAIVRAGQPGRPAVYFGDVTGELRAANPEVMESYYPLYSGTRGNEPEQYWLQTANTYLGEVTGVPAVDANLGRVYVSSLAGRLFAFLQNGQLAWTYPPLDQPSLGPLRSAPVVDDAGNIYFAADSGSGSATPTSTWQPNFVYTVGNVVQPTTPTGCFYTCTVAGTSSTTQPVWPTQGIVQPDGGVTWTTTTTWQATTAYTAASIQTVGMIVQPTVPNGYYYTCIVAGTSGATEPDWPLTNNTTFVDGTVTWNTSPMLSTTVTPGSQVYALTPDGTPGISSYSWYNQAGTANTAATWQASTAYAAGTIVQPALSAGYCYICTGAGTSGVLPPAWPTVVGATVTDGTVTWTTTDYVFAPTLTAAQVANGDTALVTGLALYRTNPADPTTLRVVVAARVKNGTTNGYYGMLYGLANTPGIGLTQQWSYQTSGGLRASPVIGSYLDPNNTLHHTIYIGDESGTIYALYENAGAVQSRWTAGTLSTIKNSPVTTAAAVSDDGMSLYVGDRAGNLYDIIATGFTGADYDHFAPANLTIKYAVAQNGVIATVWQANTNYIVGKTIHPTTPNGYYYVCATAGVSGATEPSAATIPWPQVNGTTIIDGTVTWTAHAIAAEPVSGPLTLDAAAPAATPPYPAGKLLLCTELGSVYAFDPTTFSTNPGDLIWTANDWRWNTSVNGGMDTALALRTAPALWTRSDGTTLVMVGGDDGLVYALAGTLTAGTGAQTPPNSIITVPDGLWPFFGKDERHGGSLAQLNIGDVGPLQPTLRWWEQHQSALGSSPVVTDRTPSGNPWVLQGTAEGGLYAHNASTGTLIPSFGSNGYVGLTGSGPVRGTPAVGRDSANANKPFIAVPGMGSFSVLDFTGLERKTSRAQGLPLFGEFLASPAISGDGTIYAATQDSPHTSGTFTPAQPPNNQPWLNLTAAETISYTLNNDTNNDPSYITRVRICTMNQGTLSVYTGKANDQLLYTQTYTAATTARYIEADVNMAGTMVVWENLDANATVSAFEIYAAGTVSQLPAILSSAVDPATAHLRYFTTATPPTLIDPPLTGNVTANLYPSGNTPGALFVYYVSLHAQTGTTSTTIATWLAQTPYAVGATVQPATPNGYYYTCTVAGTSSATAPVWPTNVGAVIIDGGVTWSASSMNGTLSVVDASGHSYTVSSFPTTSGQDYVVPINARVAQILWSAPPTSVLNSNGSALSTGFDVYQRDFNQSGATVYAFQPALVTFGNTLTIVKNQDGTLWQYPPPHANLANPPIPQYLAPIQANLVVAADANGTHYYNDTVYVATMDGRVLALSSGDQSVQPQLVWSTDVYNPVTAAPVLEKDTTDGMTYLLVADTGGAIHLLNGGTGAPHAGWPVVQLAESFSNSAAITAEHQAYLISDTGHVYKLDLNQQNQIPSNWQALIAYAVGATVQPAIPNGYYYTCTTAGTSGAVPPTWPTTNGATVTDNGVTWTATTTPVAPLTAPSLLPLTTHAFDATANVLALSATLAPAFTTDTTQQVRFGFMSGTNVYDITLSNTAGGALLTLYNGALAVQSTPLAATTNLAQGVQVTLLVQPDDGLMIISGYFRLPDALGNFSGPFTLLGSVSVAWLNTLLPYLQETGVVPFTVTPSNVTLFQVNSNKVSSTFAVTPSNAAVSTLAQYLTALNSQVSASSPVIDASGRIFVGTDNGLLDCLAPDTAQLLWAYSPSRDTTSTALAQSVLGGTLSLPVTSVLNFTVGEAVQVTQPDGSRVEDLGTITSITPASNSVQTFLTVNAPMLGSPRVLQVNSVTGVVAGDDVNILPYLDPTQFPNATSPTVHYLGKVVTVDAMTNTVTLDQDVLQFALTGYGNVNYAGNTTNATASTVNFGSTVGTLTVSQGPASYRNQGDIVRLAQQLTLPFHTSPAVGPLQTVYIGCDDALLYAIGPIGPGGVPSALPTLPTPATQDVWPTWRQSELRTGFADRMGVEYPGFIYDQSTGQRNTGARWITPTTSALYSSPSLGTPDSGHPQGILYIGATSDIDANGNFLAGGALLAMDANTGGTLWRFDNSEVMGQVYSSPAVVDIASTDAFNNSTTRELVIVGTEDQQTAVQANLIGAIILDKYGNQVTMQPYPLTPTPNPLQLGPTCPYGINALNRPPTPYPQSSPTTPTDQVVALLVDKPQFFTPGMEIFLTDNSAGTHFEVAGTVASVTGNTVRLTQTFKALQVHMFYIAGVTATPSTWYANYPYPLGAVVQPPTANGYNYICTIAGTSGAHAPVWPTSSGAMVADGGVTWTATSASFTTVNSQAAQQGHIYAVDSSGNMQWVYPTVGDDPIDMIYASPAVSGHQVLSGDVATTTIYCVSRTGMVYALDLSGNLLWSYMIALPPTDVLGNTINETGQMDVTSSPVLSSDGTHLFIGISYVDSANSYLVDLDTTASDDNTRMLWARQLTLPAQYLPSTFASLTAVFSGTPAFTTDDVLGDRLYLGLDFTSNNTDGTTNGIGALYCVNAGTGGNVTLPGGAALAPLVNWNAAFNGPDLLGPIAGSVALVPATVQTRFDALAVTAVNTTTHQATIKLGAGETTTGLQPGMRVLLRSLTGVQEWRIWKVQDTTTLIVYDPSGALTPLSTTTIYNSLTTNEQMLVVGSRDGNLYVTSEQFVPMALFSTGGPIMASPALSTETNYVAAGVRSYSTYIGSYDQNLYALTLQPIIPDINNGNITTAQYTLAYRWKAYLYQSIDSSPTIGLAATDTNQQALLYQAGGDQCVYCFPGNDTINPPPPAYQPPSTLQVTKSAVDAGTTNPNSNKPGAYKWWKFTVTVRNTGKSAISEVQVFDTLPAELCAGVSDTTPAGTPPPTPAENLMPLFAGVKADEAPSAMNQGQNGNTQWQITWTNLSGGAPGGGFTLYPYSPTGLSQNPNNAPNTPQLESEYMRVFTFYAAIKGSTRTYSTLGTNFVVTNANASVLATGNAVSDTPDVRYTGVGNTLYLQLQKHPIPLDTGNTAGYNQLYAMGTTTEGYPNSMQQTPVQAHTETPVSNDWSASDRAFQVHLYYNGKSWPNAWQPNTAYPAGSSVSPSTFNGCYYTCATGGQSAGQAPVWPVTRGATITDGSITWSCAIAPAPTVTPGQLSYYGTPGTEFAFSPWNLQHPETGVPVCLGYTLTPSPNNRLAMNPRMVMFKQPQSGIATSGITVQLLSRYTRYAYMAPTAVLDSHITPYAWRVTMQQGQAQLANTIEWGPELAYQNRVLMAHVNAPTTSTHITVDTTSQMRAHPANLPPYPFRHIVLIGQNGNYQHVQVVSVDTPNQFTVAKQITVKNGDEVRDEWSPDFVIANPVNVQVETNADTAQVQSTPLTDQHIGLGNNLLPGGTGFLVGNATTASTGIITVLDNASISLSGLTQAMNRFTVSLLDLRLAQASEYPMISGSGVGWNSVLDASTDTQFGVPSPSGTWNDWIDTRYDPYMENHLQLMPESLELPSGAPLATQESMFARLTRDIPLNQTNSAAAGVPPADSASYLAPILRGVPPIFLDNNNNQYMDMDYSLYIPSLYTPNTKVLWDTTHARWYLASNGLDALWDNSAGWFLDLNNDFIYDTGDQLVQARRDATVGWYIDMKCTGIYDPAVDIPFASVQVTNGNGTINVPYLDLNGNGVYDPGVDALWDYTGQRWFLDLLGTGLYDQAIQNGTVQAVLGDALWDPVVGWYVDLNGLGRYVNAPAGTTVIDPVLAVDTRGVRIFLDLFGSGVYMPGDPVYDYNANIGAMSPTGIDFAAWGDSNSPAPLATRAGVNVLAQITTPTPVIDFGPLSLFSSSSQPLASPVLINNGNILQNAAQFTLTTVIALTSGASASGSNVQEQTLNGIMPRSGFSPVIYTNGMIQLRDLYENMPLILPPAQFQYPSTWLLPKNPVGGVAQRGHTADMTNGGLSGVQPSGAYNSDVIISATDPSNTTNPTTPTLMTAHVTPTDLSQALYPNLPASPPAIDCSQQQQTAMQNWTVALTGTVSWPTLTVQTAQPGGINASEPDVPCVVACSNTPLLDKVSPTLFPLTGTKLAALMPTTTTDTNLWFRRVKHLVTTLTAPLTTQPGTAGQAHYYFNVAIPAAIYNQVRATDGGATTADVTSDFLTLRPRPFPGESVQLPWLTARIVSKNIDGTLTVDTVANPQFTTTWNPGYTVVDIYSHPWLPLFSTDDFTGLRTALDDRGNPTGGPHPLRCLQPSFSQDAAGNNWLVWTISTTRTVTVNGQANHFPVSYLLYKQFNPDQPFTTNNPSQWVGVPDTPAYPGGPIVYPDRQHPQLLPNVTGLGGLTLYDAAAVNGRQLLYATTAQPLTGTTQWNMDVALPAIDWAFTDASHPQAWADSDGNGHAESPMTHVNLVFEACAANNNINLYYARLAVNGTALTALPLDLNMTAGDTTGLVSEDYTNTGNGVFTGGNYLAWASGVSIIVNGTALPQPLAIDDSRHEYAIGDGNTIRLSVDPYHGIVRVLTGVVTSITLSGHPRIQRLTNNLAPDVNPMVSVERYRNFVNGAATTTPNYGADSSLQVSPRVWLFWVRFGMDGLGSRAYYRTLRLANRAPGYRLETETRGQYAGEQAGTTWNVDMPERMLPMDMLAPDGALFITRQSQSLTSNSPQAGLWVLSTASRSTWPPYPNTTLLAPQNATTHDLYLQSLNPPAPDEWPGVTPTNTQQ